MAQAVNIFDCHIWPHYVSVQSAGGRIETKAELISCTSKVQLPGRWKAFSPYRGLKVLHSLCLQRTSTTAQTAMMMVPLDGKHDSNEYELGTQLVYAVFAEKS